MPKPQIIIRFSELKKFLPVGHTVRDELIEQGLLRVVALTPKGRAKGITLDSIITYQRDVMGIEPMPDDVVETVSRTSESDDHGN